MKRNFIHLMFSIGNPDDKGNANNANENAGNETDSNAAGKPEKKGFIDKIKDALQEWSNNDQQEQEEDDATP